MLTKDKDEAQKEKLIEVLKEGPYRYYKVSVKRTTIRETEYFVKHPRDKQFNDDYISALSMNGRPDGWVEVYDDPYADEYDPEIFQVDNVDKNGNELK